MKTVYICSKYCGTTKKFYIKANIFCRAACDAGCLPFAPRNIFFQFLDEEDKDEREKCLELSLELIKKADEIWVIGQDFTKLMEEEIAFAKTLDKKIRYFDCDMEEYDGRHIR